MVYTCGSENRDHNETYGAKSLNENLRVKVDKTRGVSSLESVYANACKLEKHSLLKIKIVYYKIGRSLTSDKKMSSEPAGKRLSIAVRDETKHALLVAKVGVCGLVTAHEALAAADNRGNDLVANLDGFACGVGLHVLTESDDFAGTLVTESYGNKSEGVALPLVYVSTAHATSLYSYKDIVILKGGNGEFLNLDLLLSSKHSYLSSLGNTRRRLGGR
jgi:hypothetical protein